MTQGPLLEGEDRDLTSEGWFSEPDGGFIGHIGPFWRFESPGIYRHAAFARGHHKNRRGVVQGGMLMTLADRNMGSCARENRFDASVATLQFSMNFLLPGRVGSWLVCDSEGERRGRSVIFVRGRIMQNDELVATATGVWKRLGGDVRAMA